MVSPVVSVTLVSPPELDVMRKPGGSKPFKIGQLQEVLKSVVEGAGLVKH